MYLALGLFVAGGFFLSSFDAVGKLLMTDTNLLVILWARYLGQFAFSIGIALWKIGPLFVKTDHLQIQMLLFFAPRHKFSVFWRPSVSPAGRNLCDCFYYAFMGGRFIWALGRRTCAAK